LIAAVVSQAAGCIISSSDDTSSDAFITASWHLKNVDNTVTPCPSGFDTAALYSQEVDSTGHNVGQPIIDLFDCSAGTGRSSGLPPSTYYSYVAITDHTNANQYAQSVEALVDVTNSDKTIDATILNDGGYFQLAWGLTKHSNGAPITCADVAGISGVDALSTDVSDSSNSASDTFNCEDMTGITSPFLAATYTISVSALDASMAQISDSLVLTNKVIQPQNQVTNLGTVNIAITDL
jgi:hypothetical protein